MSFTEKTNQTSPGKNIEQLELWPTGDSNITWSDCFGKTVWQFLKQLNVHLACDPATLSFGICPDWMKSHLYTKIWTSGVLAALFVIAPDRKQPKSLAGSGQTGGDALGWWNTTQPRSGWAVDTGRYMDDVRIMALTEKHQTKTHVTWFRLHKSPENTNKSIMAESVSVIACRDRGGRTSSQQAHEKTNISPSWLWW